MKELDRLTEMFKLQGTLQQHLGYDFDAMDAKVLIEYIRTNVLALTHELHEALDETYWKPWAAKPPGFRDHKRYLEEIVDATHFLLNLCVAGRITADELFTAFEAKNLVNHQRKDAGYTGMEKCDGPGCRRSLDDPLAVVAITWGLERFCGQDCADAFAREWQQSGGGEPEADA